MSQTQRKIAIVEDEGLIVADLELRLKRAGYTVAGTADSGQAAMELIEKTSPDLVLMDIRLKGPEDGIVVAGRVRERFGIPVIYLTASDDRQTLERAEESQPSGYVKKPIATASLRSAVERVNLRVPIQIQALDADPLLSTPGLG